MRFPPTFALFNIPLKLSFHLFMGSRQEILIRLPPYNSEKFPDPNLFKSDSSYRKWPYPRISKSNRTDLWPLDFLFVVILMHKPWLSNPTKDMSSCHPSGRCVTPSRTAGRSGISSSRVLVFGASLSIRMRLFVARTNKKRMYRKICFRNWNIIGAGSTKALLWRQCWRSKTHVSNIVNLEKTI